MIDKVSVLWEQNYNELLRQVKEMFYLSQEMLVFVAYCE